MQESVATIDKKLKAQDGGLDEIGKLLEELDKETSSLQVDVQSGVESTRAQLNTVRQT